MLLLGSLLDSLAMFESERTAPPTLLREATVRSTLRPAPPPSGLTGLKPPACLRPLSIPREWLSYSRGLADILIAAAGLIVKQRSP